MNSSLMETLGCEWKLRQNCAQVPKYQFSFLLLWSVPTSAYPYIFSWLYVLILICYVMFWFIAG